MAKRMSDDDVQDYVYKKMFGDLDRIESDSMFKDSDSAVEGIADNAKPESQESGGMKITIEPLMRGSAEGGKLSSGDNDLDAEEDKDRKKGMMEISKMSPLMEQLHGKR